MRRFGVMLYITPLQIATESSSTPKSVMKTMVGGYFGAVCCAGTYPCSISTANRHTLIIRVHVRRWGMTTCIDRSSPKDYSLDGEVQYCIRGRVDLAAHAAQADVGKTKLRTGSWDLASIIPAS